MAVKNGSLIVLKLATEKVNGLTSNGIDFARDMIDVTTKDSTGNAKEYIPGEKGATISFIYKIKVSIKESCFSFQRFERNL